MDVAGQEATVNNNHMAPPPRRFDSKAAPSWSG